MMSYIYLVSTYFLKRLSASRLIETLGLSLKAEQIEMPGCCACCQTEVRATNENNATPTLDACRRHDGTRHRGQTSQVPFNLPLGTSLPRWVIAADHFGDYTLVAD